MRKITVFILAFFIIISLIFIFKNRLLFKNNKKRNRVKIPISDLYCPACNIVFISFDTLRVDRVHAFGYNKDTTPAIDQFSQKGFIFTNTISASSWTLPSTMSWFTGVYPSRHKVLNKFTLLKSGKQEITNLKKVSPKILTLAEILKENGYKTGGFTGGAGVNHQFGFDAGFDIYSDDQDFAGFKKTVPEAVDWIKGIKTSKFFVFLHGYDIHGQYVPEEGYDYRFVDFDYKGKLTGSKQEQKQLREEGLARGVLFLTKDDVRFLTALYDEKVQRADEEFGKFISEYQKLGLMNKTIFILTSDHGEELYEHGQIDHGHSLYEELIHVPLIIYMPDIKSKVIDSQVRSIDIIPTLLEIVEITLSEDVGNQLQGESLVGVIKGEKPQLPAFSETNYRYAVFKRAVRTNDFWKYIIDIETDQKELYKINSDPIEKNNLINNNSQKQKVLDKELNNFILAR